MHKTVTPLAVTTRVPRIHPHVPSPIARAVTLVGAKRNAWIALDATLAGLATGVAVGLVVARIPGLGAASVMWASGSGLVAATAIALYEAKTRWLDPYGAASILDQLLNAKDRFVSALHFAAAGDRGPIHELQLEEASSFLGRFDRTPAPPRPQFRSPRFALVAMVVAIASFAVPLVHRAVSHWIAQHPIGSFASHDPDSPQAIAARAAALREALRDSPNRRIDAEINALERSLTEQAARAEAERTQAIERAAQAIEAAHRDDLANARQGDANDPRNGQAGASQVTRESLEAAQRAAEQAAAAEAAAQQALQHAEARAAAAQRNGDPRAEARERREREQAAQQLAAAQARHLDATREAQREEQAMRDAQAREAQAQNAANADRTANAQNPTAAGRTESLTLDQAVRHLDEALRSIERNDRSTAVPSERTGQAIDRASREVASQLPDTSHALADASRARAENDGQRVDEALERAREALAREAHAEPEDIRRAREAIEALHDQVAQNAQMQRQNGENASQGSQSDRSQGRTPASINREQEALRNAADRDRLQNSGQNEHGERGDQSPNNQGNQAQQGQNGAQQGQQQQGQNGSQTQIAQQGTPGQNAQQGQNGQQGEQGPNGMSGRMGRREPGMQGAQGQGTQSGSQMHGAWAAQGMMPANQGGVQAPMGGMQGQGAPGTSMQRGNSDSAAARNGGLGGEIGNDRGNGSGLGYTQGNRTTGMGATGTQMQSRFDRGNGSTESNGRNQMVGRGAGQAHGSTGSSGGGTPGGNNSQPSQGGTAWGMGAGDRLTLGEPGPVGPFGHDVDPGGSPQQLAQLAPGARGVMMPGIAQQGEPTGPTSEAPVAPGSLLPNDNGNGALGRALDDDPERTMTTQHVPASLRAYVRRYFQGLQTAPTPAHPRTP